MKIQTQMSLHISLPQIRLQIRILGIHPGNLEGAGTTALRLPLRPQIGLRPILRTDYLSNVQIPY